MLYIVGTVVMNTWAVDVRVQSIAELKTASDYDPVVGAERNGAEPCRNSGSLVMLCF
jgi:hypothetical protein